MIEAYPCHAEVLAATHAAAFSGEEVWDAQAFAVQLALPGVFGLIENQSPPNLPQVKGGLLARVAADQAEILTLAVIPSVRRRGVGAALLRAAMNVAAARGATTLFLEVSAANAAARALYADAGFQQVGRRDRYYPDGADALVLARRLSVDAAATG